MAMCGRFVSATPPDELARYFQAAQPEVALEPSYNVAPTNQVYAVRAKDGHRQLETMKWGLVPSWAKDVKIGSKLINAKAETVAEKPSFRSAYKRKRCLVPADGFYEWAKVEGQVKKQPYFIHRADEEPVVFAGLWEAWKPKGDEDAEWLITCTLLTTTPNKEMAAIHNRMPVLIPPNSWDRWLDPESDPAGLADLLKPSPDGLLELRPVSTLVNSVRNKGSELLTKSIGDESE